MSFSNLFFETVTLEGPGCACDVLNAEDEPGGVGSRVTVPATALGDDGILNPGESFEVVFEIGLQKRKRFTFFVDVFGLPNP